MRIANLPFTMILNQSSCLVNAKKDFELLTQLMLKKATLASNEIFKFNKCIDKLTLIIKHQEILKYKLLT